jgi:transketolase
MKVIVPADAEQARQAVHVLAADTGPAYLRLSRPKLPVITHSNNFTIGKAQVLKQGVNATIIACGEMVAEALEAAKQLLDKGKSIRVINMHTIKPLDTQVVINAANETGIIITAEDHQVHGGLGSAVAEVLAQEYGQTITKPTKFKIIGVEDMFGESGKSGELLEKYGLTSQAIKKELLANLKN